MKVVTAVEKYAIDYNNSYKDVRCFLAGGITKCPEWLKEVIKALEDSDENRSGLLDDLVIFNPRRENFPIDDPNASMELIQWEFTWLQHADIFSMYFAESESDQPICMYELGRNICTMQHSYPKDFDKRIVITCDPKYSRYNDVRIQTRLAYNVYYHRDFKLLDPNVIISSPLPEMHAKHIINAYKYIKQSEEYLRRLTYCSEEKI